MSADELTDAIRTRLLDQCALDDARLAELCGGHADHAEEIARLERKLAGRRLIKNLPIVGPLARALHRRLVSARRFGR